MSPRRRVSSPWLFGAIVALASAVLVPTLAASPVQQSGQRGRGGGNAATVYRQAFGMLGDRGVPKGMTAEEFDELLQLTDSVRVSPNDVDRARELLAKAGPFLSAVSPAGAMRRSDFELDRSRGFEMMLPHLSSMRSTARLMRAQAAMAMHDGDWETTLSSLRSLASLGGHSGQDEVLISSLVGTSITSFTMSSIDATLDEGTLTQERAKALAEALQPYRGQDPFSYADATRHEFGILATTVAGKDGDAVSDLANFWSDPDNTLRGMSAREVARHLQRGQEVYERAATIFESQDPEAARQTMAELEREAERNPVMRLLMPSFSKALESKLRVDAEISDRLARIDAIAEGKKSALEMANASTWLRRAAAIAAAMPDEAQEAVEVVRFAGRRADRELLERADRMFLGAGQSIREALVRALACGTVDLDVPNDGDYGLSMQWLPGLRAATRIMLAEASTRETAVAMDRARLVMGVCQVLVRDPSMMRSIAARSIAEESMELLTRLAEDPSVDPEASAALARTLRELSASEGFRLARGLEADRDRLSTGSVWGRIIDPKRRKHLARRGPEFALFLQVAAIRMERGLPMPPRPPAEATQSNGSPATPAGAPAPSPPAGTAAPAPPAATPAAPPPPGVLVRADDLLPPELVAQARRQHVVVAALPFFETIRSVSDDDTEARQPFKGVTAITLRPYGLDLAAAGEVASRLSTLADRFDR